MPRPQSKEDFRKQMAEEFVKVLEEKELDWKKNWSGSMFSQQNGITHARYRGTNAFWLSLVAMQKGYKDPRWVTSIQVNDAHRKYHPGQFWHIKAGEKATYVEYWFPFDPKEKKGYTWPEYRDALQDGKSPDDFIMTARYTPVFNAEQVEGIPPIEKEERNTDIGIDQLVDTLSANMGVNIIFGGDVACYIGSQDTIKLPEPSTFTDEYAFNATALHELSHATGHESRLGRPMSNFFGTPAYAYEELVAEIASCFMGAELQIEPTKEHLENHKAYVQSWVKAIRDKPDSLISAVRQAQTAADYMEMMAGLLPEREFIQRQDKTLVFRQGRQVPQITRYAATGAR